MNEIEGLIYVPKFVQINSDYNYGDVVTHESYTELLNLNQVQGDYNTEVLRKMFTSPDAEDTYHIPYLDNEVNTLNGRIDTVEGVIAPIPAAIEGLNNAVDALNTTVEGHTTSINEIINVINTGVDRATHADVADTITGASAAGTMNYYGTDTTGDIGFHPIPDFVSYDDYSGVAINSVYIVPKLGSVTESMLDPDVRTKLNREGVTSYEALGDLPSINDVTLIGAMELVDLGIQPAGNYLTAVPDTYSTTAETVAYVEGELANYITSAQAATTYRTEAQVSSAITTAVAPYLLSDTAASTYLTINDAKTTYNRVGVNSYPSSPRVGDLYIQV